METQPFFLSKLPIDVTYKIYWELCKQNKISDNLKNDIKYFQKLYSIIDIYKLIFPIDDISNDDEYYLFWLENDLVSKLNDDIPLMYGVSPKLQIEYPSLSSTFLRRVEKPCRLTSRIFKLWSMCSLEKKMHFFNHTLLNYCNYVKRK